MATIISKNFYLTNTQMDDNSGLIGYQNLVTPSTITATSQLSSDPITSAANPATAWGWVAGDQPAPADAIEYAGTNYMPSPFDPSGWFGAIYEGDDILQNQNTLNSSGNDFMGYCEQVGSDQFILASTRIPDNSTPVIIGDKLWSVILIKKGSGHPPFIRFRFADQQGFRWNHYFNVFDEKFESNSEENMLIDLGDQYLIGASFVWDREDSGAYIEVFMWSDFVNTGTPSGAAPIGSNIYAQAAYFGKADDWPATVSTQGVVPDQTVTINTGGQQVDYIGIAKHNLNQIGLTVTIKYNGITVVPAQPVSEKQALLFLNNIASPDTVELIISGATSPPRIAVLYVGKALRLQRNIYVGHTPISYGRNRTAINGVSENGQYLGEIVVRELNTTSVNLQNLTPDWYRQNLDPFFALSPRPPCFWAWRPSKYESEVGYCWVEGDPQMSNQRSNGMVQCSWNFKGIV